MHKKSLQLWSFDVLMSSPPVSPVWSPANSFPLASFPRSYHSYRPGKMKANTCFLRCMRTEPNTSFQTVARAALQGSVTLSEESAICPLPHTWAHRQSQMSTVIVIDRGERVCHPSHRDRTANFALLEPTDGCGIMGIQTRNHSTIRWTLFMQYDFMQ